MRGEGEGSAGSQPMSTAVHRSPYKLWRSTVTPYLTYAWCECCMWRERCSGESTAGSWWTPSCWIPAATASSWTPAVIIISCWTPAHATTRSDIGWWVSFSMYREQKDWERDSGKGPNKTTVKNSGSLYLSLLYYTHSPNPHSVDIHRGMQKSCNITKAWLALKKDNSTFKLILQHFLVWKFEHVTTNLRTWHKLLNSSVFAEVWRNGRQLA